MDTYDHPDYHAPSEKPIEGCPHCDKAVKRPIKRGFGKGQGSEVLPPPEKGDDDA